MKSDPDRIQTCNLLIRSQMLYSVEPRGLWVFFIVNGRKGKLVSETSK